jgi:hypothetical protein
MKASDDVVFLLDVDNTLLDNDRVIDDLRTHLASEFGPENRDRYWEIFEALRAELGYADDLGALQRYRLGAMNDPRLLALDPRNLAAYPPADLVIERIGDLLNYDFPALFSPARAVDAEQETT